MGIGKSYSLFCQFVNIGCRNIFSSVAPDIPVSEIIGKDYQDIRELIF